MIFNDFYSSSQKTNCEDTLLRKTPQGNANLSMILEQSKERYSSSSVDSCSSQAPKTPKSGPVISASKDFLYFIVFEYGIII